MANCTNCGFQLDPNLASATCPRCGTEIAPVDLPMPAAGGPLPPPPGPGAPPAFDSDARPDSTLFGLPAAQSETEMPLFSAPSVPTPTADEGFGGLDAPLPPPPPSGAPQRSTDPHNIGEFDFGSDGGSLQLDVGLGGGSDASVDLPAPAAPRPPAPPRAPAPAPPPPNFSLDQGGGAPGLGDLDLPAPAAPRSAQPPAAPLSGLDLPAPAARRPTPGPKAPPPPPAHGGALDLDLPAPAHLDLPAPAGGAARPAAPAGLDLPLGDDLDLPQPADAAGLPAPLGLDLPGAPDVDLPSPRGMEVEPANNLVAPSGLDLEPASTGVAPADMGVAPHDLGMLAPKADGEGPPLVGPDGTPLEARPGFATPRGPNPREVSSTGGSRKVVYAAAAIGLVGALVGGLYIAGVFDSPPPPTPRGLQAKNKTKKPDGEAPAAVPERSAELLAQLDADTPASYAAAVAAASEGGDAVGAAEAALLLHLRFGPDNKGANAGAAGLAPFEKATEPHIKRVLALGAIARGQLEQADGLLTGETPRTRLYRALLRLAQERPGDAISEAKSASEALPDSALAKAILLQAQIDKDPAKALETATAGAKGQPGHPAVAEALARAAVAAGALKTANEAAGQLPTDGAPAPYQARAAVLRGEIAAAQGDTTRALAQFDTALKLGGENVAVLEGRVRAAIAAKDFTAAQESMAVLAKLAPSSVDVALLNIEMLVAAGDGDAALTAIETLAKAEPKRIELPYWRGEVQAMRLQVDEAQAEFATVLKQDPTFHRVALAQAAMLQGARQPVEAAAALDAGVSRLRESSGSTAAIAELLTAKARLLLAQNQRKAALSALDQALEAHPTDNAARVLRGTTRVKDGDREGGKADLLEVYERAGGYPGLVAPLGKLFIANGQLEELETLVGERATDPNANNAVKLVAARLRLAQNKPEEAKLLADEILARSSNAWEAQVVMAQAFLDAGDPVAALKRIETVRPPEPQAEVFLLKGKILEFNAKHTEARSEYARALALEPDMLEARFLLGRLLAYSGQAKQALAELEQVTNATDAYPRAYLNIGRAQRDLGKNDDALASFAKTLELDATLLEAHYLTGRILLERGKAAKAITAFESASTEAAKGEVWFAEVWLFMGRAQEKAGKRGAAKTSYQRFLKEAPAEHASRSLIERTIAGL